MQKKKGIWQKSNTSYRLKTLNKLGKRGTSSTWYRLSLKSSVYSIFNSERPLEEELDKDVCFHHIFNIVLWISARRIRQEKRNEKLQIRKKEEKLFLVSDDKIWYIEKLETFSDMKVMGGKNF